MQLVDGRPSATAASIRVLAGPSSFGMGAGRIDQRLVTIQHHRAATPIFSAHTLAFKAE